MHAHALPIMFAVRIYESEKDGFTNKEPYSAVCLAQRIRTTDEFEISLMIGEFNPKAMKAVMDEAKRWGASKIWYERHGKLRSLVIK